MAFSDTLNTLSVISWLSVWLVEETVLPRENHRPVTSHWHILNNKTNLIPQLVTDTPRQENEHIYLYVC
jgi:hypothetical protein